MSYSIKKRMISDALMYVALCIFLYVAYQDKDTLDFIAWCILGAINAYLDVKFYTKHFSR